MAQARRVWTNFSKGELSPLLDGRPDLALYFEGLRTGVNWYLLRQGGITRRPGLRFVTEVKDSTKDVILVPFIFSVDEAYVLEMGHEYIRFFKNGHPVLISPGGAPIEIASPYQESNLRSLHFTQSADVLFIFHPLYQQRRLSRVSDTSWFLNAIFHQPPPSFEADTNIAFDTPGAPGGTLPPEGGGEGGEGGGGGDSGGEPEPPGGVPTTPESPGGE